MRRIDFMHVPYWLAYNFDVYIGHHRALLHDGRATERYIPCWCIIVRYLPPPDPRLMMMPSRPTPRL